MRIKRRVRGKAIPGTDKHIVKSSTVGGMRQVRCSACHGMMVPTRSADGTNVLRCACGATATSRPM